jgi:hypothetical protein
MAYGTMEQEHFHGDLRGVTHGDSRIAALNLGLHHALTVQFLRSQAGVEGHIGVCNRRRQGAEARFRPVPEGIEMPTLGSVFHQVISALKGLGFAIPYAMILRLGFDLNAEPPPTCFLHEVLDRSILSPPRGARASVTTLQSKMVALKGLNNRQRRVAAQQIVPRPSAGVGERRTDVG